MGSSILRLAGVLTLRRCSDITMHSTPALLVAFAAFVATSYAAAVNPRSPGGADGTSTKCVRKPVPTCLSPEVLQTASFSTGQEEGTEGLKAGQSPSDTYVVLVRSSS